MDTKFLRLQNFVNESNNNNNNNNNNTSNNSLCRSRSKDTLNNQCNHVNLTNKNILRPKSAGQGNIKADLTPCHHQIVDDFQSKRQFFENRTYTDFIPKSTSNRSSSLSNSNTTNNNNCHPHHIK